MNKSIIILLTKLLRETADKIDAGSCELSESTAMDIMSVLSHEEMSKEDACLYLNVSRSKFDEKVRSGELPKGKKRRGWKELRWYKDELMHCMKK